jgi:hypothetical protein
MGRRAKNKQSNPEPLSELTVQPSPRKRKAGASIEQKRPVKKVKDSAKPVPKPASSEDESSGGWDDVQDEATLPIQTKCVDTLHR